MSTSNQCRLLLYLVFFFYSITSYGTDSLVIEFKKDLNTYSIFHNSAPNVNQNFDLISNDRSAVIKGEFKVDEDSERGLFIFSNVKNWGEYQGSYSIGDETTIVKARFVNKKRLSIDGGDKVVAYSMTKGDGSFEIFLRNEAEIINIDTQLVARLKLNGAGYYFSGFSADLSDSNVANGVHGNTITVHGGSIPAGQYLGEIYINDEYNNRIPIGVDISVKEKWHIPILVLMIGLALGLLTNLYRVNKENYDLFVASNGLITLVKNLKPSFDRDALIEKIEVFKKSLVALRWKTKSEKVAELDKLWQSYEDLSAKNGTLDKLSPKQITEIDLTFKSLQSIEYMGKIGTFLVICSTLVLGLIVFNKLYIQDLDFGANLLTDYLTLLLGGAASSSTSSLVFGKKYVDV